jgi:hypothetical protein
VGSRKKLFFEYFKPKTGQIKLFCYKMMSKTSTTVCYRVFTKCFEGRSFAMPYWYGSTWDTSFIEIRSFFFVEILILNFPLLELAVTKTNSI